MCSQRHKLKVTIPWYSSAKNDLWGHCTE